MGDIFDMHPHPCHPLRPGNIEFPAEKINALLKYVDDMMTCGAFYEVVSSSVYAALKAGGYIENKLYAICDDGETITAMYFGHKSVSLGATTDVVYYGSSEAAPTTADELVNSKTLPVSGLQLSAGYKSEWVAIPSGYGISKWVEDTLKSDITYATGTTITKNDIVYTVYHYTTVLVQGNTSSVTIVKQ